MTTIWKFQVRIEDAFTLEMPKGAKILSVQTQGNTPCLWAMVDPQAEKQKRYFSVFGTGFPFEIGDHLTFVGTFQIHGGSLVFHLFEFSMKKDGK